MIHGKSKPKRMKCRICGDYFEALKRNAKHCAACRAEMEGDEDGDAK